MMKQSTWIISAVLLLGLVGAADAQFPTKKAAGSAPAPTAPAVEAVAPAPPPVVNVAPPVVNVAPQVSLPAPSTLDEVKSWLTVVFGGLIAAFLAKIGFKPAVATSTPASVPAGVTTILTKLKDPDTLAGLEALGLKIVQSGVPGTLIQGGAGLVGGGAIASVLEPMVRQAVIKQLGGDTTGGPSAPDMNELTSIIAGLKDLIEKRLPSHA